MCCLFEYRLIGYQCQCIYYYAMISFTGSIPGGLTATLALHKWRSKNATFKTPLYL